MNELNPIAPRRSATSTIADTSTAAVISARCGVRSVGWTASSCRGSSRRRAIDSVVRLTPASSDSSTPAAATAAPTLTTGAAAAHRPASTVAAKGAGASARTWGPTVSSADSTTATITRVSRAVFSTPR